MKSARGGVRCEDLRVGDGAEAVRGGDVEVRYDLYLRRGERVQHAQLAAFRIGDRSVIAGLEYGVEGMREGGRRRIRVGPHLGYGARGVPGLVPPDAVLDFDVVLVRVGPRGSIA